MTIPAYAGCPWPVDEGCLTDWDTYDPAVQGRAVALASATLRRLSGYRVGGCPVTVRPCKAYDCNGFPQVPYDLFLGSYGRPYYPTIDQAGFWVNSCGCTRSCACTQVCEVVLPAPVGRLDRVMLNGTVLPTTSYRVDGNRLVWTGTGTCGWPACQDMTKADTQPGTFSVTYLNAYPPDGMAAYAVGVMANEFAKACTGNKCRLPASVSSVARGGVSYEVVSGSFPGGVTGIREVDAWLALYNPGNLRQQPTVWYPGVRTPRVVN